MSTPTAPTPTAPSPSPHRPPSSHRPPSRPRPPLRRPVLHPALSRAWRDPATLQLGDDPERAVVVGGLDPASREVLAALDGTRTHAALLRHGADEGLSPERTTALLDLLHSAGVLGDAATDVRGLVRVGAPLRERLGPDLASLAVLHGPDAAPALLARRQDAAVRVVGAGRVGATLAVLLAAAGVGRVVPEDEAPATPGDVPPWSPAGTTASTRGESARRAVEQAAPGTPTSRSRRRPRTDLVVLVAGEVDRRHGPLEEPWLAVADGAARSDTPLLHVRVRETAGIVGPLVVPGTTSCLRCQQFHRAERDPAWPRVAAQLAAGPPGTAPCDGVLATATAALAALHALAWLDGGVERLPSSADASLEVTLPEGRVRRRPWPPHPSCGCRWPGGG